MQNKKFKFKSFRILFVQFFFWETEIFCNQIRFLFCKKKKQIEFFLIFCYYTQQKEQLGKCQESTNSSASSGNSKNDLVSNLFAIIYHNYWNCDSIAQYFDYYHAPTYLFFNYNNMNCNSLLLNGSDSRKFQDSSPSIDSSIVRFLSLRN